MHASVKIYSRPFRDITLWSPSDNVKGYDVREASSALASIILCRMILRSSGPGRSSLLPECVRLLSRYPAVDAYSLRQFRVKPCPEGRHRTCHNLSSAASPVFTIGVGAGLVAIKSHEQTARLKSSIRVGLKVKSTQLSPFVSIMS